MVMTMVIDCSPGVGGGSSHFIPRLIVDGVVEVGVQLADSV